MIGQTSMDRVVLVSLLGLATALVIWSCSGSKDCGCGPGSEPGEILYSCSFESDADTLGWTGYGVKWLADDAPQSGGSRALGVNGGCIAPHAVYTLDPVEVGCYYTIRCWAKEVNAGGRVQLRLAGSYEGEGVDLLISGPDWMCYSSAGCVWCPAGRSLEVDIYSGGFGQPGGMLVDLLEVVTTDCLD